MIHFITKQKNNFGFLHHKNVEEQIDFALTYLKSKKIFAFDTENTGLDPYIAKPLLQQYGDSKHQFILDAQTLTIEELNPFLDLLEDESYQKILANAKYDYKIIRANYLRFLLGVEDLLLNEIVAYNGLFENKEDRAIYKQEHGYDRFSLAELAKRYLQVKMHKEERNTFIGHTGDFTKSQVIYAADDIIYSYQIFPLQKKTIEKYKLKATTDLENFTTSAFGEMEFHGIRLIEKEWLKVYEDNLIRVQEKEKELEDFICARVDLKTKFGLDGIQSDLFGGVENAKRTKIKWSSAPQKADLLEYLGVDVYFYDRKKGETRRTAGKDHILQFIDQCELIKPIIEYGEISQELNTYGKKFLEHIHPVTGKVHTSYDQIKVTGRVGSSNPNLQNQPALKKYRNCYQADAGNNLITADYSNMELRLIAEFANDPELIQAFNAGHDVHSIIAMKIYKTAYGKDIEVSKEVNKDIRDDYKTVTFGLAYGASAFNMHKRLLISVAKAQELIDMYFAAFPTLKKYFTTQAAVGFVQGFIRTAPPVGRIRWFPKKKKVIELQELPQKNKAQFKKMLSLKGDIERTAMNTPIQGTSADIVKRAAGMLLRRYIEFNRERDLLVSTPSYPYGSPEQARLILQVHDEFVSECGKSYSPEIAKSKEFIMEMAANETVEKIRMIAEANTDIVWNK